ncbi:hypothetical protein LSPH24S_09856 [Lysinibacillus sphaericus]
MDFDRIAEAVPALLVGCGKKKEPATTSTLEEPQMLEVEILTSKEVQILDRASCSRYPR